MTQFLSMSEIWIGAIVVGGIIPAADAVLLTAAGVARVFTPKDYDLTLVIADLVALVEARAATA